MDDLVVGAGRRVGLLLAREGQDESLQPRRPPGARIGACRIHLATGHGPWENSGTTCQLASILASKGIRHSVDDWGPMGGHDWPFWRHQMREYVKGI